MFPRWLTWLFLIALGYMVVTASNMGKPTLPTTSTVPPINEKTYPALAQLTDVEGWKRAINPDYAATMNCSLDKGAKEGIAFKVVEEVIGTGAGATCGESITIALTVWNANGAVAYTTTAPLALGTRALASGLDFGLLGMKPGGTRTLLLPPHALSRGKPVKELAAAVKALPAGKVAIVTIMRVK